MSDEQFHEFQLDGKQLVFLFMAGTVVAVVIFLCGVMVGRGVQAPRMDPAEFAAAVTEREPDVAADAVDLAAADVPAPTLDELTYSEALPRRVEPPPAVERPAQRTRVVRVNGPQRGPLPFR